MTGVVVAFPAHPKDCGVCRGKRRVSWCGLRSNSDGDLVADLLGTPMACLPIPVYRVPMLVDTPRGGPS